MKSEPNFLSPNKCPECGTRMGMWLTDGPAWSVDCAACGHHHGIEDFMAPAWTMPALDETDFPEDGSLKHHMRSIIGVAHCLVVTYRQWAGRLHVFRDRPTWFVRVMARPTRDSDAQYWKSLTESAQEELALRRRHREVSSAKHPWWAHALTEDGGSQ